MQEVKTKRINGLLSEVLINGRNIINPWGIETADRSSFYSHEPGIGYRYKEKILRCIEDSSSFLVEKELNFITGSFLLKNEESFKGTKGERAISIESQADGLKLMDFVLRYRFKKEEVVGIFLGNEDVTNLKSGINYVNGENFVKILFKDFNFTLQLKSFICPESTLMTCYVRDAGKEWIVHFRVFPDLNCIPKLFPVIKLCTSFFGTRPLPDLISSNIHRCQWLRSFLMYRGEKGGFFGILRFFNPNLFYLFRLPKGDCVAISVSSEIAWTNK